MSHRPALIAVPRARDAVAVTHAQPHPKPEPIPDRDEEDDVAASRLLADQLTDQPFPPHGESEPQPPQPRRRQPTASIALRIPLSMLERLDDICAARRIDQSSLVRYFIEQGFRSPFARKSVALLLALALTLATHAQIPKWPTETTAANCEAIAASYIGVWKPLASAPRDGTPVEVLNTYGVAPTYGLFRWTKDGFATDHGKTVPLHLTEPEWVDVGANPGQALAGEACMFWRPYSKTGKYIDPTRGSQNSTAYWCGYMQMGYDRKKDVCVPR